MMSNFKRSARGFTLAEMLVVLFMMSLLTILTLNVTGPWLAFRAQGETEQRLQSIRAAIEAYYDANAYAVVGNSTTTAFGPFVTSTVSSGNCSNQEAAFQALGPVFDEGAGKVAMDAYKNSFCVFVQRASKQVDGATIYYRSIAFVSAGQDGKLDSNTDLDATSHELTLGGDDKGFVFNGLATNLRKLQVTQDRLARIGKMYEIYFTSRFLNNSSRDLSRYYFSTWHDNTNPQSCLNATVQTPPDILLKSSRGTWGTASDILGGIGVGADLGKSAWDDDSNNNIQVGNCNESDPVSGLQVRSPQTTGAGFLPYTALLRARLPAPPGASPVPYVYRVVAGGY